MSREDDEAAAWYEDPEHRRLAGPWVARRARLGLRGLRYIPPECGPQTQTVNIGSFPYWEKNPDYRE